MVIDVVVVVLVVAFAVWSYFRGLLRKLAGIAALVVASVTAKLGGRWIAHWAATRWNIQTMTLLYILCTVIAWFAIFVLSWVLFRMLARWLGTTSEGKPAGWNRVLGGLFGAAQMLLTCWFFLAVLDVVPEDIRASHLAPLHRQMEDSWVMAAVEATNPAARVELQPLIEDVSAIAARPAVLRRLADEPVAVSLCEREKVKAVLADEALVADFAAGRYRRFFSDRRVRDALEDPEIRDTLRQTDVRDTLRRLAKQARAAESR